MNHWSPNLSGAVARTRIDDMLRTAELSRVAAALPARSRRRTLHPRPGWWIRSTARTAQA